MDMKRIIDLTAQLIRALKQAYTKRWSFLVLSSGVFLVSVLALGQLGLLPNALPAVVASEKIVSTNPVTMESTSTQAVVSELPMKIEIPVISLAATVANPTTTVIAALDEELKSGAVRYPTSAKLGETGNVVLFGHSSYLPVVLNQAYKTFNGIQKLVAGDVITVYSSDTAYTYRVRSVSKESTNDAGIPLTVAGRVLTLSTCDSFGAKTDRFVVVADFVESHSISG